jgi:hypothetical protein
MTTEKQIAVQFHILPRPARVGLYKVVAVAPDGYADIDEVEFRGLESEPLERLGRLNPWGFRGRSGRALSEHLRDLLPADVSVVEVRLPHGPVAALNWEHAAPRVSVIRRPHNEPDYLVGHVVTPLRMGVCSLTEATAAAAVSAESVEQLLRGQGSSHLIETFVIPTPASFGEYLRELEAGKFQGIHILLRTETGPPGRHVRVGRETVALETFISETAHVNAHFVILHDTNPKPVAGISALRWDSQTLPANSGTAFILLAAPKRGRHTNAFLENTYRQVFRDTPLVEIIAPRRAAASQAVYAGAVANPGVVKALDMGVTSSALENRLRYLQEQRDALASLYPEQDIYQLVRADQQEARQRNPDLDILRRLQEQVEEGETEVAPVLEDVIKKADRDKPRYPAALFYLAGTNGQEDPIPKISTISPPPPGLRLELHFWIDVVEGGIDYKGNIRPPEFVKRESSLYPMTLLAEAWSEDFIITERRRTLVLPEAGSTNEHARFPLTLPQAQEIPRSGKRGEIFIFLQYPTPGGRSELVAVFRIEALITRSPEEGESAQILEHSYLATDWFRFKDALAGSALTIFLARRAGRLQVFTLNSTDAPWGQLGATEESAYQVTREIYRYIHRLSLEAAAKKGQRQNLSFRGNAEGLAQLGYRLFSTILFSPQTDPAVRRFYEGLLASLPEHSEVTIALNKEASNFIIPWGLMYDRDPPPLLPTSSVFGSLDRAEPYGFWGVRYNLSVKPFSSYDRAAYAGHTPARMGAAWHTHTETSKLESEVEQLEEEGSLIVERIKASNEMLPSLLTEDFDLIQFFCHGYTSLPDKEVDPELIEGYKRFTEASHDEAAEEVLMIMNSPPTKPSFMLLDGGAVPLPKLSVNLKELPGRPLVLLSMCESAQVTCAGAGFVTLFLDRGARSVIGTEGPTLWSLGREMDVQIIRRLLAGQSIGQAFSETRRGLVESNVLALIYSLFGDAGAKLKGVAASPVQKEESL